jgi:hypothetical protein
MGWPFAVAGGLAGGTSGVWPGGGAATRPVQVVADGLPGAGEQVEDPLDPGDGERDQARVMWWQFIA